MLTFSLNCNVTLVRCLWNTMLLSQPLLINLAPNSSNSSPPKSSKLLKFVFNLRQHNKELMSRIKQRRNLKNSQRLNKKKINNEKKLDILLLEQSMMQVKYHKGHSLNWWDQRVVPCKPLFIIFNGTS